MDPIEALGEIKPIDDGATVRDIATTMQAHRTALLQVAGDTARVNERVDRMIPEMTALLDRQRATARAEWQPGGKTADLEARFLRDDGSVRFGSRSDAIVMPDGSVDQVSTPGLLDSLYTVTPEHERLVQAYARYALAVEIERQNNRAPVGSPMVRTQWRHFVTAAKAMPGRVGDFLRRAFSDPAEFKRVLNGTSGTGGELIAVPTTSALRRPTDLARRVPGLITLERVSVPSFKAPIVSGRGLSRKRGNTSNDPSRYTVSAFTTSEATLSVVNRQLTALIDPLWLTDAVSTIGDPMGLVMDWLAQGDADTLELAMLHGDTAGTHQDTLSTWTMGGMYTAGDLAGSDSPAAFWIGFRARAADDSKTASAGGTLTLSEHFAAIEALGVQGGPGVVCITGLHAMYTQYMVLAEVVTVDVFGAGATAVTGQLGQVGGTPIVISQQMPNQFDTSSGLYTGSNLGAAAVYVQPGAYRHYELDAGPSGDFDVTRPERGAQYVGLVRRSVLAPVCPADENPAYLLYNL